MTESEAVEKLKNMRLFMQLEDNKNECKFTEDDYKANEMAIQALDKQTPKKIVTRERTESFIEYVCPKCKNVIMTEIIRNGYFGVCTAYCSECGQRLDWSNIENGEETDETD
jgi:phage FluMu protein Com